MPGTIRANRPFLEQERVAAGVCACVCAYVWVCVCMCVHMLCMRACGVYVCMHVCAYVCVCVLGIHRGQDEM